MPSKNTVKQYAEDTYYHVYNRGVAKQIIFHNADDKKHFMKIISRHLDPQNSDKRYDGVEYIKWDKQLDLLSYCLMGNHFHLLLYMRSGNTAVKQFMKSLLTAYTMYYNKKYKRVGSLFQGTFKASRIDNEAYLHDISRYIHRNPRNYESYHYSSFKNYINLKNEMWLKTERISSLFSDSKEYAKFVADFDADENDQTELKYHLADR